MFLISFKLLYALRHIYTHIHLCNKHIISGTALKSKDITTATKKDLLLFILGLFNIGPAVKLTGLVFFNL